MAYYNMLPPPHISKEKLLTGRYNAYIQGRELSDDRVMEKFVSLNIDYNLGKTEYICFSF